MTTSPSTTPLAPDRGQANHAQLCLPSLPPLPSSPSKASSLLLLLLLLLLSPRLSLSLGLSLRFRRRLRLRRRPNCRTRRTNCGEHAAATESTEPTEPTEPTESAEATRPGSTITAPSAPTLLRLGVRGKARRTGSWFTISPGVFVAFVVCSVCRYDEVRSC